MTEQRVGTREEWPAVRLELLEAETEHTHRGDELARRRRELPWVRIDKEYRFDTDEGPASLVDLFRGRSQAIVYHFSSGRTTRRGARPARDRGRSGVAVGRGRVQLPRAGFPAAGW